MQDANNDPGNSFRNPLTVRIVTFLREIGLQVEGAQLIEKTVIPGVTVNKGTLLVDEDRLDHPGDLLHEAGHLAVVPAEKRAALIGHVGTDAAEEMTAIAWSWAALTHLELDPGVVFHPTGYRGGSQSIIQAFQSGPAFGVPVLQWLEMTCQEQRARELSVPPFPHMLKWLRD